MGTEGIRPEGIAAVAKGFAERIGRAKKISYSVSFHDLCENHKETVYPEIIRIRREMYELGEMMYSAVSIALRETDESGREALRKQYDAALKEWEKSTREAEELAREVSLSGCYGSKKTIGPEGSACFRYEGSE